MKLASVETASGACDCWIGGEGSPLLLIHGGWAGAEVHWGKVWHMLAERHSVIAIELPGIWKEFERSLPTYSAYASLCADLLAALGLSHAAVTGNSLGASIGWQLALDRPELVRQLIMVDGFAPKPLPMRPLFGIAPLRALAVKSLAKGFYSPILFDTAFADPANVPATIRENFVRSGQEMAAKMFRLLYAVTGNAGQPSTRVDFIWGEKDRLPNVSLADGQQLRAAVPGARLIPVAEAGHLPQVENPDGFLAAIEEVLKN